eukprot:g853.t1
MASKILSVLRSRRILGDSTVQCLGATVEAASGRTHPPSVYCGFDPTGSGLHVGHLVTVRALQIFQRHGVAPIALIGGATAQIGDPSGKSVERPFLSEEECRRNSKGIQQDLEKLLNTEKSDVLGARISNNAEWYEKMSAIQLLRDVGRHLRMGVMLGKESVKARLASEQGMSFTEFSYQMMQAFDFLHLYRNENCVVQVGGTDQWGNITAGCDLIRKVEGATIDDSNTTSRVAGVTVPLLLTSSGEKFGKSAGNAVWLNQERTSHLHFYQFFLRQEDNDVENLLYIFTDFEKTEVEKIMENHNLDRSKRIAQRMLAREVTSWVRGSNGLDAAERATEALYGDSTEVLKDLTETELLEIFAPEGNGESSSLRRLSHSEVVGSNLAEVLIKTDICTSKGNCRKLLTAGAIYLNNEKLCAQKWKGGRKEIEMNDLLADSILLLRIGKRNYFVVHVTE